jgi:hypothetical protein
MKPSTAGRLLVLGALVGALMLPVTALVPVAEAVGTGDPVILSPVAGQTVPQGWTGTVHVDFADAVAASYLVQVECPPGEGEAELDDYLFQDEFVYDGTQDDYQATVGPIHTASLERCEVTVTDHFEGNGWAVLDFFVGAGVLSMDSVSRSPAVFYPLVQDGFRDSTTLAWRVTKPAGMRARITDSRGRTVRYANLGSRSGPGSWSWAGYRDSGARAAPGRYSIELVARDAELGTLRRAVEVVRVATAVQTLHASRVRTGDAVTGSAVSGPCSMTRDPAHRVTELACRGGGYAQAWFRFVVPASAYAPAATVGGQPGPGTAGTVSRQVERLDSRSYRVGMRVTGTRSFTIASVRLTYSYRHRI